jgi:hypothetical protein
MGCTSEIADFALLLEYVADMRVIASIRYVTSHPNEFTQRLIDAYEKIPTQPLIPLGTYTPETETFTLVENWKDLYEAKLQAYRTSEKPRSRLPQQPTK